MTCIRSLQAQAGRIGRQLSDEYARAGETVSVQELRSEETRTLRAIEQAHRDGPCRCEACALIRFADYVQARYEAAR